VEANIPSELAHLITPDPELYFKPFAVGILTLSSCQAIENVDTDWWTHDGRELPSNQSERDN
jgi:hypothetical protein